MLGAFFRLAALSPTRVRGHRLLLFFHLTIVIATVLLGLVSRSEQFFPTLGYLLLVSGIVEGAILLGWRLTQLPKSRSLELLLISPWSAWAVMLGEQLVSLTLFLFLTLSTAPVFALLVGHGWLGEWEALTLLVFSFTWGAVTGLGLCWWAFEGPSFRKWGDRAILVLLLVYLVLGGLIGEHTFDLLNMLPFRIGSHLSEWVRFIHENSPFALVYRINLGVDTDLAQRVLLVEGLGLALLGLFLARSASRLKEHYIDLHFRPLSVEAGAKRGDIGEHPLRWWAIRRVNQYPGTINLYLAGGAATLYSAYLVAGANWPAWMGTRVFWVFEQMGGVPGLATVLTLLAAVPAAYQYGLWDNSPSDRIKKLELLLLSHLNSWDYLIASLGAAWNRGRGYLGAAFLLWCAGAYAGRISLVGLGVTLVAATCLVVLCFAIGFRWFTSDRGGASIGFFITVVVPVLTWGLVKIGLGHWAQLAPPGMVYFAPQGGPLLWLAIAFWAVVSAWLLRQALVRFDPELRLWYDQNHGAKRM